MLNRRQFDALVSIVLEERTSEKSEKAQNEKSDLETKAVCEELINLGLLSGANELTVRGYEELEEHRVRRAVFIAAGFGSRLKPITINTPKPLVRVHGVRIIDRLIDACLSAGIEEIYIVRGYLAEQFDQLKYKYPMVRFIENTMFTEANNISSAVLAKSLLSNAYVFEADLLLSNPSIIKKYQYTSNFLAIKKEESDDWCFEVRDGVIVEEKVGGSGNNNWQMVGISYWSAKDGEQLSRDLPEVFAQQGGKNSYWEQVPLVYRKENYRVEVRPCNEADIVEIDTFEELKALDQEYRV